MLSQKSFAGAASISHPSKKMDASMHSPSSSSSSSRFSEKSFSYPGASKDALLSVNSTLEHILHQGQPKTNGLVITPASTPERQLRKRSILEDSARSPPRTLTFGKGGEEDPPSVPRSFLSEENLARCPVVHMPKPPPSCPSTKRRKRSSVQSSTKSCKAMDARGRSALVKLNGLVSLVDKGQDINERELLAFLCELDWDA